jgi:hypothetical protein
MTNTKQAQRTPTEDDLIYALRRLTLAIEIVAEKLTFVGPPGHANGISKKAASERLIPLVAIARAAIAKAEA